MAITTTQGFVFKLVAEGVILDLFADEEIRLSDNVTGLFDLGVLPSDFTRQISLPGTKKNNAFFEHVYDISVQNPDRFSTNQKVSAYLDFDGIYLAQGYLQLNKVNIIANKFIDSYEVTIYGAVSSFARLVNRTFLTDLSNLSVYNHTASLAAITSSWSGSLFNGDIVYPLAEYGQKIEYTPEENNFGIDSQFGGLCVQDFKPSIRLKAVWDKIFEFAGFTYSGSFFNEPWLDNVYMVCNRQLRYPVFAEENLETYGQCRIAPISGSGQTNWVMNSGTEYFLPWVNVQSNPGGTLTGDLVYQNQYSSSLRGVINLNFEISGSGNGGGLGKVPEFDLLFYSVDASTVFDTQPLNVINGFLQQVQAYNGTDGTKKERITISQQFNSDYLASGSYKFKIRQTQSTAGAGTCTVTMEPGNDIKSYFQVTKNAQAGEGWIMNIPNNMPFGTSGIKLIDFIKGVQRKFNLVIYPSKTVRNQFIVETFNNWYKKGEIKNFNKYINLDNKIEVVPANNFAVNELNFGDTLDQDYISQQFSKQANREFGKEYFIDTQNFFSDGKYEVKTTFASTPLSQIVGTGVSGSVDGLNPDPVPPVVYQYVMGFSSGNTPEQVCEENNFYPITVFAAEGPDPADVVRLFTTNGLTTPFNGNGFYWKWGAPYLLTKVASQIDPSGNVGVITNC
jgi:hypothetical protein